MAVVTIGFRWLDILEKEFDKAFVDLEVLVGDVCEYEEGEIVAKAQHRLQSLSSCFAQLTHKAQTIFQNNAKLEAELVHLRREVAETKGQLTALQHQQHLLDNEPQTLFEPNSPTSEHTKLLNNHEPETPVCSAELPSFINSAEVSQLQQENRSLRRLMLRLQGELCGARLAAKYLDKELAGRIQQLQLLGRETRWHQQEDKLWRQLEAEINLHRHKTVVRACRANIPAHTGMQTECMTSGEDASEDASEVLGGHLHDDQPRPRPQHHERTVVIHKQLHQNLGMSVTGGREHGVPIVVSVVHPNTPASDCRSLYVGDAILAVNGQNLSAMNHSAAVALLSRPAETVTLHLLFVPPESDETCSNSDDPFTFKYGLFDDDVVSVASSICSVVPRRCPPPQPALDSLSRASVDSVRGSCDDLLTEDSLAEGVKDLGAEPAVAPIQASCPEVSVPSSDVGLESGVSLNSSSVVSNCRTKSYSENGHLLLRLTTESDSVATAAATTGHQDAVKAEHGVICEQTPSTVPHLPENNSSPLIPVYRKHSLSNAGPPSSPPTPVHRKYSSNSARHKHSYSRNTSLMNCDEDVSPSMAIARSKSIPGDGSAYSSAQDSARFSQIESVATPDSRGEDTRTDHAVPFSRRSSPSATLLNSSSGAGPAGESSSYEYRTLFQKVEQEMTVLSADGASCEGEPRPASAQPAAGRCTDADTTLFNGSY